MDTILGPIKQETSSFVYNTKENLDECLEANYTEKININPQIDNYIIYNNNNTNKQSDNESKLFDYFNILTFNEKFYKFYNQSLIITKICIYLNSIKTINDLITNINKIIKDNFFEKITEFDYNYLKIEKINNCHIYIKIIDNKFKKILYDSKGNLYVSEKKILENKIKRYDCNINSINIKIYLDLDENSIINFSADNKLDYNYILKILIYFVLFINKFLNNKINRLNAPISPNYEYKIPELNQEIKNFLIKYLELNYNQKININPIIDNYIIYHNNSSDSDISTELVNNELQLFKYFNIFDFYTIYLSSGGEICTDLNNISLNNNNLNLITMIKNFINKYDEKIFEKIKKFDYIYSKIEKINNCHIYIKIENYNFTKILYDSKGNLYVSEKKILENKIKRYDCNINDIHIKIYLDLDEDSIKDIYKNFFKHSNSEYIINIDYILKILIFFTLLINNILKDKIERIDTEISHDYKYDIEKNSLSKESEIKKLINNYYNYDSLEKLAISKDIIKKFRSVNINLENENYKEFKSNNIKIEIIKSNIITNYCKYNIMIDEKYLHFLYMGNNVFECPCYYNTNIEIREKMESHFILCIKFIYNDNNDNISLYFKNENLLKKYKYSIETYEKYKELYREDIYNNNILDILDFKKKKLNLEKELEESETNLRNYSGLLTRNWLLGNKFNVEQLKKIIQPIERVISELKTNIMSTKINIKKSYNNIKSSNAYFKKFLIRINSLKKINEIENELLIFHNYFNLIYFFCICKYDNYKLNANLIYGGKNNSNKAYQLYKYNDKYFINYNRKKVYLNSKNTYKKNNELFIKINKQTELKIKC